MSKQTAVEWLIDMLDIDKNDSATKDVIKQAKAMEKEQKEYFFNCGRQYQLTGEGTFTEVYNETHKGGEDAV
jgi:hypothetical protein